MLADFKAAFAAPGPLHAALDRAIDRRDMANLLALKADGEVLSGSLILNDQPLPERDGGAVSFLELNGQTINGHAFTETMPSGWSYRILHIDGEAAPDMPAVTVPPGQLFVVEDNRDYSLDSRMPEQFGPVLSQSVMATGSTIFWSHSLDLIFASVR